ncbi:MAG: ROK family transcriptional regulator [Actinobacteria bacterium]|nr:ROK family transcriptional regulator [Actinomycetota bacterium]
METVNFSAKPSLIKRINKNIVLNIIRNQGPISRAKLSKVTKISRPTMSNIISLLEKDKLIKKSGIGDSAKVGGKKPVLYKFNKGFGFVIGSQIRVNEVITILTNYNAEIISKIILKIGEKRSLNQVIDLLFNSFTYVIKESNTNIGKIKGIGIGLNGIVDYKNGILKFISHFPEWGRDIEFVKIIKDKYKIKTFIDNNCRMLASAEKIFSLGINYNNIVVIDTEEGIGSGVIIKGDIYRGTEFLAGEIGHTIIYPEGPKCACGKKGCAEVLISTDALIKDVLSELKKNSNSYLHNIYKGKIDKIKLKDIFSAYVENDPLVEKVMSKIEYWFALLISNTILNYDPGIIIIQGDYTAATKKFIDNIKQKLKNFVLPGINIKTEIELSNLGKYAGPIGSASLVLSQFFDFSNVWKDK